MPVARVREVGQRAPGAAVPVQHLHRPPRAGQGRAPAHKDGCTARVSSSFYTYDSNSPTYITNLMRINNIEVEEEWDESWNELFLKNLNWYGHTGHLENTSFLYQVGCGAVYHTTIYLVRDKRKDTTIG